MTKTMSQKAAREGVGNPDLFEGGVYVTKNGRAELFMQTAAEREAELAERQQQQQNDALFKILLRAKQDIANHRSCSPEEAKKRLRAALK